jgi:L,D-peptidoglycan transpeptidase YkuD (ErfK/YbiS/YcfS/YnhG family)
VNVLLAVAASQLVVGLAHGTHATLFRYERDDTGWHEVGAPIEAVIGRNGAAWDKREGDGRSPLGAFELGRAWSAPFGDTWRCVDDPDSAHYGELVDEARVTSDWASAEDMGIDPYRLGVEVGYNAARTPGRGSCIFLHVWDGPDDDGTAGCTAMAAQDLAAVVAWVRPGALYLLLP